MKKQYILPIAEITEFLFNDIVSTSAVNGRGNVRRIEWDELEDAIDA